MDYREHVLQALTNHDDRIAWRDRLAGTEIAERSLEGIEPFADKQAVFTASYSGLARQSFDKAVIDGMCLYNGIGNLRCAVGVVLPFDVEGAANGCSAQTLRIVDNRVEHLFQNIPNSFLMALQKCHDNAIMPDGMKQRLEDLAQEHDLKIPTEATA